MKEQDQTPTPLQEKPGEGPIEPKVTEMPLGPPIATVRSGAITLVMIKTLSSAEFLES